MIAGHSRTIVGIEELKDGSRRLLILDPSCQKRQMQQFNANMMRAIRKPLSSFKAKQYQIVAIRGVLNDSEYEVRLYIFFIFICNQAAVQMVMFISWSVCVSA